MLLLAAVDSLPRFREFISHESDRVPDKPGSDAQSALESAARVLRATARPIRGVSPREREVLAGRQVRDLLAWARESSRLIEPRTYLLQAERGGEEHRVWPSELGGRVCKCTYPGRCGFTVLANPRADGLPGLAAALPLEYLERLLLSNEVFGDDIQLDRIALEEGKPVILTSQPAIIGAPPSLYEIESFMRQLWFRPLTAAGLGRPGALGFYRDLDEVAAFDAHPGNFVKDEDGVILPIDLILVRADAAMQSALAPMLV